MNATRLLWAVLLLPQLVGCPTRTVYYDAGGVDAGGGGSGNSFGTGGAGGHAGIPGAGVAGAPAGGNGGSAGAIGHPGTGGLGGTTGSAGMVGSGGVVGSGGSPGAGGSVATGGFPGIGGAVGTGGTGGSVGTGGSCQPKSRDCTSPLDNNCNGTPDNQETTYCACSVGQSRTCQEHPGYDGVGICKAGMQTCKASADKTASSWDTCSGAVDRGVEVCDAAGQDENCNGQSNEGCDCVNGTSVPCDCGPATTCTNGKKGACTVTKVTLYLDADGDGFGNAAKPGQVCPGAAGYVTNGDDCDDGDATFKPGVSTCAADHITKRSCATGASGVAQTQSCDYGCMNGGCRSATDGMIGVPGYVSCTNSPRCSASGGCVMDDPTGGCGTSASGFSVYCDGPNDCPGQKCVLLYSRALNEAKCYATQPSNAGDAQYYEVCDPLASTCQPPLVCTKQDRYTLYTCQ
jgi:hypothetical protein